jgi:hypothetical protein
MIGKSIDSRVQDNIMANMGNPARLKQEVSREISDPRITPDMAKLLASRTLDDLLGALTRENQRASQTPPSLKDQADGKLRNKIEMLMGKTSAQQPMGIPSAMPTQMGRVGNSVAAINQMAMRKAQPPRVPTPQGGIRQPMPQAQPPRGNPPVMKKEGGILAFAEGGRPDITNEQLDLLGLTIEEYNALSPEEAQLKLDIVRGGLANPVPEYTDEERAQDAEKVDSLLAEIDAKTYSTNEERDRLLAEMGKKKGEEDKKNKTDELTSNQMGPPSKKGLKSIPRSLDKKNKTDELTSNQMGPPSKKGLKSIPRSLDKKLKEDPIDINSYAKERTLGEITALEREAAEGFKKAREDVIRAKPAELIRLEREAEELKQERDEKAAKDYLDNRLFQQRDEDYIRKKEAEAKKGFDSFVETPPIETGTGTGTGTDTGTDTGTGTGTGTGTETGKKDGFLTGQELLEKGTDSDLYKNLAGEFIEEPKQVRDAVIAARRKRLEATPDQRKLAGMLGVATAGFGQNPLTAGATAMADYGTRRATDIEKFLQETEGLQIEGADKRAELKNYAMQRLNEYIDSFVNLEAAKRKDITNNAIVVAEQQAAKSADVKNIIETLKLQISRTADIEQQLEVFRQTEQLLTSHYLTSSSEYEQAKLIAESPIDKNSSAYKNAEETMRRIEAETREIVKQILIANGHADRLSSYMTQLDRLTKQIDETARSVPGLKGLGIGTSGGGGVIDYSALPD